MGQVIIAVVGWEYEWFLEVGYSVSAAMGWVRMAVAG